jgi:hypothetical protein
MFARKKDSPLEPRLASLRGRSDSRQKWEKKEVFSGSCLEHLHSPPLHAAEIK